MPVPRVSIYGAGQLGHGVAGILRGRGRHEVLGPFDRLSRATALSPGADVVLIATTTRMHDVLDDIASAVSSGSNVLVSAEECANPWLVDPSAADRLNDLAIRAGVSILGAGLNPGLVFDSLVLTLLGACPDAVDLTVTRTVDLSGFGATVHGRLGIGYSGADFARGTASGAILGHAGFPQSMSIVGRALGRPLGKIQPRIDPIFTSEEIVLSDGRIIEAGRTAGVEQRYEAVLDGHAWYVANFVGHVAPTQAGLVLSDVITLRLGDQTIQEFRSTPCFPAQTGSQHVLANSVDRILDAPAGWLTVADLPPATPTATRVFPGDR